MVDAYVRLGMGTVASDGTLFLRQQKLDLGGQCKRRVLICSTPAE